MRVATEGANQRAELSGRSVELYFLGATHHQSHAEIAAPEIRIRTDFDIGMANLQFTQFFCQRAFPEMTTDAAAEHLGPADEAVLQLLENPLHDVRYSRQHEDVADSETGCA